LPVTVLLFIAHEPHVLQQNKILGKILSLIRASVASGGSAQRAAKLLAVLKQDWRDCGRIRLSSRAAAKLQPTF
jgi:hypothetical protein